MMKILPTLFALLVPMSAFAEAEARRVIRSFDEITFADREIFGDSAAYLAETRNLLPEQLTLPAFAIPFYFYRQFVKTHGLARTIQEAVDSYPGPEQTQLLVQIREKFLTANLPFELELKIEALRHQLTADAAYRFEPSTNRRPIDDLMATLVHPVVAKPATKTDFSDAVRQVWAGAWTGAALADRIALGFGQHGQSFDVGVIIQPDIGAPVANGLAFTKDALANTHEGFLVYSRIGEIVPYAETSPEPEVVNLVKNSTGYDFEARLERVAEGLPDGQSRILEQEDLRSLYYSLVWVQARFAELYNAEEDSNFTMAVAFCLTADDRLILRRVGRWPR